MRCGLFPSAAARPDASRRLGLAGKEIQHGQGPKTPAVATKSILQMSFLAVAGRRCSRWTAVAWRHGPFRRSARPSSVLHPIKALFAERPVVTRLHAASRRPARRRSQPATWFQLANVWLTNLRSLVYTRRLPTVAPRREGGLCLSTPRASVGKPLSSVNHLRRPRLARGTKFAGCVEVPSLRVVIHE